MTRITIASVCMAYSLTLATGCDKAADEQRQADAARLEAETKSAEANREATGKINAAQVEADKKVADAQADFLSLREAYRHKVTENLIGLDKDIANLDAKLKTATGKVKTDLEARLPGIRSQREAFSNEYKSLELASALTWDNAKTRLDKAWDELKKAVGKAD